MTEVALTQVDEYCAKASKSSGALQIVGCYFAHERNHVKELSYGAQKLADKIAECSQPALVLLIDNAKIADVCTATSAIVCSDGNKWVTLKEEENKHIASVEAIEQFHKLVREGKEIGIADFD